jgi:sarcosine oxidase subunit beta
MTGFMQCAVEKGARLIKNAEVTAIERDSKGVVAVVTSKETFQTRTVVNAAGAWAAPVARMLGIELPVEPLRRMLVPTEPFDDFPRTAPMIIDMSTGFHFRPEGRGFLLAWNDSEETTGYKTDFDPAFVEKILDRSQSCNQWFQD